VSTGTERRIFSGIQPTGAKHFGNYAGGFRQYVEAQEQGDAFFCIVDLHTLSVAHDPGELRASVLDLAALLYTFLDDQRSTIFVQSHVAAHAESAWLLGSVAGYGELRRMTQFKDKGEQQDAVNVDLLTYPVLMAGDILLYQTDTVPVGDDQRQHVELARDVAQRFNTRYGPTFRIPEGRHPSVGARIMDLQEPTRKMSTTGSGEMGRILLLDPPDLVRRKLKSAVTDTGRGIPAEHLPRVFDRLYRVDRSRTAATGGAGLGLAIVKSIAELHGGTATVTSELGTGTRVTLLLPAAAPGPEMMKK